MATWEVSISLGDLIKQLCDYTVTTDTELIEFILCLDSERNDIRFTKRLRDRLIKRCEELSE